MPRPTKIELLSRFFPEIKERTSKADTEQSIAYNTLACEAILADQIRLFDKGLDRHGPGVLTIRLQDGGGESAYLPLADLQLDRDLAAQRGDLGVETLLADVIAQIEATNPNKAALVLLIDNSSAQLFPIEREYPARSVQALLEEFAA